jgi:hypothetical protein
MYVKLFLRRNYVMLPIESYVKPGSVMAVIVEDPAKTTDLWQVTDKLYQIMYTSPWSRFKLTTSVVIGTDCTGSCKFNYHSITTKTAPNVESRRSYISVLGYRICLFMWCFYLILELYRQCGTFVFLFDCGAPQSNRKTKSTTLSVQLHNQIEKQKYHTVGTVPQSNRKTKVPHCRYSSKIK